MMSRVLLSLLFAVLWLAPAPAARAQVKVVANPPTAKTRSFSPRNPPRDMPPLKPGEAAVTESKFACGVQVSVEIATVPGEQPTCTITGIDANLRLDVVIWLPTDTTPKIRAHEDGHRQISELFYARAEPIAKELAAKYVGRKLDISGIEKKDTQPAIEKAATKFCQEYLGAIEVPSQKVQERYDELTDHGRNRVAEKDAIKKAMQAAPLPATAKAGG